MCQTAELCAAATKEVGEENAVQIANYLCKGNYAVSGSVEGCDVIERIAKPDFKARMTVRLAVAGAFHTRYMQPAVKQLLEALATTDIVTPRIPVISNVDAVAHSSPEVIKDILSRQVGLCYLIKSGIQFMSIINMRVIGMIRIVHAISFLSALFYAHQAQRANH